MSKSHFKLVIILFFILVSPFLLKGETPKEEQHEFDVKEMIMHHIKDMHSFPIISYNKDGEDVEIAIPLPVILFSEGKLYIFMSSAFDHGKKVVTKGNKNFVLYHERIYETNPEGEIIFNEEWHPDNKKPLDLSVTRNVFAMWFSAFLLILIFVRVARRYKTILKKPTGIQSLVEPLVLFVRDDIANELIGKEKAGRYMSFLMTVFFFIWINNLIGVIPFFPGGSNLTGNISVTFVLAVFTFLITNFNGTKTYWRHILAPPGIPIWVSFILVPIEIIGIFTKPFALMVRLFANITAGHIIILSMASLIFIFSNMAASLPVSFLLQFIMLLLELLVGFLQAFIFTLLSALFIGMAVHNEEH